MVSAGSFWSTPKPRLLFFSAKNHSKTLRRNTNNRDESLIFVRDPDTDCIVVSARACVRHKIKEANKMGALNAIVQNWDLTLFQPDQLQPGVNSDRVFCKGGVVFVFVLKRAFRSAEFEPILKTELPNLSLTRRFVWGQGRLVQRD